MIGESIRPELVTAVQRGAGIKAGTIDLAQQLLPVMIVEDISRGPFPPSRIWHAGLALNASVGNFAHIGVCNNDKAGAGSSLTVDYLLVRPTTAMDLVVVVGQNVPTLNLQLALLEDCSNEAGGLPAGSAFDPQLGNGFIAGLQNVVGLNGAYLPHNTIDVKRVDGPWTLGPGAALMVRCTAANVGLVAYFKGRYHVGT